MDVSYDVLRIRQGARKIHLAVLAIAACCLVAALPTIARENTEAVHVLEGTKKRQMEEMLTRHIQELVNSQERLEGQRNPIVVDVLIETETRMAIVDLSENFVPTSLGADFEEITGRLYTEIVYLLEQTYPIRGVKFLYGGKGMRFFHPGEYPEPKEDEAGQASRAGGVAQTVVVSAGHGRFLRKLPRQAQSSEVEPLADR